MNEESEQRKDVHEQDTGDAEHEGDEHAPTGGDNTSGGDTVDADAKVSGDTHESHDADESGDTSEPGDTRDSSAEDSDEDDGDAVAEEDEPEDLDVDVEGGEPGRLAAVRRQLGRKRWWVPVSVVVIVALVAGAFLLGRGANGGKQNKAPTVPAGFATYRSPDGGFSISYPAEWQVVPNSGVPLLLSAGGNDALSIRELTLQQPVDTKNVASIRAVTDAILSTPSAQLQVLLARPITIGGIAGYYYLYTFPAGNDRGVHAHYFLFQGRKLTTLVFQALPIADFQRLAPLFDQVSGSFRSNPKILAPTPAPATTAPGSTAPGSSAPGATAPPTTGPATSAPGTTAPGAPTPGTTLPGATAPPSTP